MARTAPLQQADGRLAGEARFSRFVKHSAMSKSERELAESSDDEFSPRVLGEWLESEVRRHGSLDEFFPGNA